MRRPIVTLILFSLLLPGAPAVAQDPPTTGTITGTLTDDTGAPIRGLRMRLLSITDPGNRKIPRGATTDRDGRFEISGLPPGQYRASFQGPGYLPGPRDSARIRLIVLEAGKTEKVEVTLARANVLVGRVLYSDGSEVGGARVTLKVLVPGEVAHAVNTRRDGTFAFPAQPEGPALLTVLHGWHPPRRIELESASEMPAEIVLEKGATALIELQLPENAPPPRNVVLIDGEDSIGVARWNSERNRYIAEDLEPGARQVSLKTVAFVSEAQAVTLSGGQELTLAFELQPAPILEYTVQIETPDGQPVVGAELTTQNGDAFLSDDQGQVKVQPGSERKRLGLTVRHPGLGTHEEFDARPRADASRLVKVVLEPAARIEITVNRNGAPVIGSKVSLQTGQGGMRDQVETTPDGKAIFAALVPGDYTIQLRDGGRIVESHETSVTSGQTYTTSIPMPAPLVVKGRILLDGKPARGGGVLLSRSPGDVRFQATLDDEGRFEATVFGSGLYRIRFHERVNRGQGPITVRRRFSEVERTIDGQNEIEIDLPLHSFSGRLLDVRGEPLTGARVRLVGAAVGDRYTDAAGAFRFDGIPEGSYEWFVHDLPEGNFIPGELFDLTAPREVEFRSPPTVPVILQVVGPELFQLLQVQYYDGFPRQAMVNTLGGEFRVWLPVGEHRLLLSDGLENRRLAYAHVKVTEAQGVEPVRIGMEEGANVWVQVWDAAGQQHFGWPIEITRVDGGTLPFPNTGHHTNRQGRWNGALPWGRYRFAVTLPDGTVLQDEIEVKTGRDNGLHLRP